MGDDDAPAGMTGRHLPRFLVTPATLRGDRVRLDPAEAKHARVRRVRVGEAVALFDGEGGSAVGVIEAVGRDATTVAVTARQPDRAGESPLPITLAVALLKSDKMEWVIEKATELGVTRVVPFTCRNSLASPSSARRARWRDVAVSAAKQSGRSVLPRVEEPLALDAVIGLPAGERLLFWEAGRGGAEAFGGVSAAGVLLVVGPEGGFHADEVAAARSQCRLVSLGPRILRAETAAVTAVALCQYRWGDGGGLRR